MHRPARILIATSSMVLLVSGGAFATPLAVWADPALPGQVTAVQDGIVPEPAADPVMGDYSPQDYVAEAAALPSQLIDALESKTGQSGAEYLAQAAAAAAASAVTASLVSKGADLLGSRLDGTVLVVNVADAGDIAAVAATGARGEVGVPEAKTFDIKGAELMQDISGGEAFYFEGTDPEDGARCSIGFNGHDLASGADEFATAGHCTKAPLGNNGQYEWLTQTSAGTNFGFLANSLLGTPLAGSFVLGGGYDTGLVRVSNAAPRAWTPKPRVTTWQGGAGSPTTYNNVTDRIPAIVGATICKSGATSGWTCGVVDDVAYTITIGGSDITSVISNMCIQSGDSGGAAMIGNAAVGINSWSTTGSCADSDYYSGVVPLISADPGVATVQKLHGDKWEPAVLVNSPSVSTPASGASVASNSTMNGLLPGGNARQRVEVFFDGSTSPRAAQVSSNGSWSISLNGLVPGSHAYMAKARWGTWSQSAQISGSFSVIGSTITGTISGGTPAAPIAGGVCATAYDPSGTAVGVGAVNANGGYTIANLPAAAYRVNFTDCSGAVDWESEWWDNSETLAGATAITTTAGQTSAANAVLTVAGPFADVRKSDLFAAEMTWMYDSGISTGYIDGSIRTYHPLEDVSRQAMAAFLYRQAGAPFFTSPTTPSFTDVPTTHGFYKQIEWMKSTGLTTGNAGPNGTLTFAPDDTVTRQAMSAFLYRAAGSPPFASPSGPSFTDVVDGPFYTAVEWMKANNITTGYVDGATRSYHPVEAVSRRAMAAFLYRFAS